MAPGYTVEWLPAPGLLFKAPETAGGISHRIRCVIIPTPAGEDGEDPEPPPEVVGYRAIIEPAPPVPVLELAVSGQGVTLSAQTLAGLFGIDFIDYLQDGVIARVTSWGALPAQAEQVIEFRPSRLTSRSYLLQVTAELTNGEREQASYTLTITQEWTAGRDRLKEEVNARSNKTR
ncbi:hypothetical protein PU634_05205 [Oceanimonas pelagia]|uniref:Uncharacterized protein n=1 Tax=Oceanimonas pelagia TaxID=3028314 RepID=A0AA50KR36_9GAMM|nr:hypothetical protein [Oceanimonas pelagia]WMC11766.1 hypothetical protein PU634_05205 [Oceanimonas pelagia]